VVQERQEVKVCQERQEVKVCQERQVCKAYKELQVRQVYKASKGLWVLVQSGLQVSGVRKAYLVCMDRWVAQVCQVAQGLEGWKVHEAPMVLE